MSVGNEKRCEDSERTRGLGWAEIYAKRIQRQNEEVKYPAV